MTDDILDLLKEAQNYPDRVIKDRVYYAIDEILRLRRYENLAKYIAGEYHELSWEKVISQRDHWKKECRKLIEEDNDR